MNQRLLPLTLFLLSPLSSAQLEHPGRPASLRHGLDPDVPAIVLARPDVERYLREDAEGGGPGRPFRYGAVIANATSLERDGRWDQVEATGELVWRVELRSPGAFSLGLLFREYDLPPGGELYVYRPDGAQVLGAFTESTEQPNGMLGVRPLRGDRLVLEYVQGPEVSGSPRLALEHVVHDYRDVYDHFGQPDGSAQPPCLIDVNCPQGAPYQDLKRSIVALFVGGFACSGAIINNTAQDATPFMLTAEHCGDYTNGTFVFNYERTGCGSGTSNLNDSLSGARSLAKDGYVDARLWRLNQAPPASYRPYYAGWGRGSSPPAPTVGISHPSGLPKKIHIDDDEPNDATIEWRVNWDQGEIQWGSSGSPLFAANGRVIGPLSSTTLTCAQQISGYGQFRKFYNRRSLERWLDPLGLVPVGIDGYDPFAAAAIPYNGSGLNAEVYASVTPPALGTTWVATVDASAHAGATLATIEAHVAPSSGAIFTWGELLMDLGSARVFRKTEPVVGGISTHSSAIPNDPGLAGAVAWSQAFVLGGGAEATNGLELRVF